MPNVAVVVAPSRVRLAYMVICFCVKIKTMGNQQIIAVLTAVVQGEHALWNLIVIPMDIKHVLVDAVQGQSAPVAVLVQPTVIVHLDIQHVAVVAVSRAAVVLDHV